MNLIEQHTNHLRKLLLLLPVMASGMIYSYGQITCLPENFPVSLSTDDCTATITPELIVPSENPADFTIELYTDMALTDLLPNSPELTTANIGETVFVKAIRNSNGNFCWTSTNLIEDKFVPDLLCSDGPIDVLCTDNLTPTTTPVVGQPLGLPVPVTASVIINADGSYTLGNFDACGDATLTFEDSSVLGDCPDEPVRTITRTWTVVDEKGNTKSCLETIIVARITNGALVMFPETEILACNSTSPPNTSPQETGFPQINGVNIPETFDNTCGLIAVKTDMIIPICGGATIINREWTVFNCMGMILAGPETQQIKLLDEVAPVITGCPTEPVVVSTSTNTCTASVAIATLSITDACSGFTTSTESTNGTPAGNFLLGLPLGTTTVTISATDDCDNTSTCVYDIEVEDQVPPATTCETNHSIGLNNPDISTPTLINPIVFDDGSNDACSGSNLTFLGRRLANDCNAGTPFAETVPFFCCDIGNTVTVIVQITDEAGNSNFCTKFVTVGDAIPPAIACPLAKTIECTQDYQDLSITGNAVATDNCGTINPTNSDVLNLNTCEVGTVTRTFTATDAFGNNSSCVQVITIVNTTGFSGLNNITFPNDIIDPPLTCTGDTSATINGAGIPIVSSNSCDNTGIGLQQLIILPNDPNADYLYKIERTWIVFDWCDLDENNQPARYTDVQFIKVIDGQAPTFNCPSDLTVTVGTPVTLEVTDISDNCSSTDQITVTYNIDQGFNGTFSADVSNQSGANASGNSGPSTNFPVGINQVIFKLTDGNNQSAECIVNVNVTQNITCSVVSTNIFPVNVGLNGTANALATDVDLYSGGFNPSSAQIALASTPGNLSAALTFNCSDIVNNAPTPVEVILNLPDGTGGTINCPRTINIVDVTAPVLTCATPAPIEVSAGGGSINIAVNDLLDNTSDVCSGNNIDVTANVASVSCADIPSGMTTVVKTITVMATDQFGNSATCPAFVTINSNSADPCSAPTYASVSGGIQNEEGTEVEYVMVEVSGDMNEQSETTESGTFTFDLPIHNNYVLTPERNDNPLNGVSTFDLVKISKHILNIELLPTPYKRIAADINRSGSITTFDLVALRKVILFIDEDFQDNTSWRFVDANFVFPDPTNPFATTFPEVYSINDLGDNEVSNFVAVKVGDVNCSATANDFMGSSDDRNNGENLVFSTKDQILKAGKTYTVDFDLDEVSNLQGYQFTLAFDAETLAFENLSPGSLAGLSENNFGLHLLDKGIITTSWHNTEMVNVDKATSFSLTFTALKDAQLSKALTINSRYTKAQAYLNNESSDVSLAFESENGFVLDHFQLFQNRPNPFTGETVVSFTLPKENAGTLTIYDLAGRQIKTVQATFNKGYNEVGISSAELNGHGVFYYQLEVADHTATRKMVLLK